MVLSIITLQEQIAAKVGTYPIAPFMIPRSSRKTCFACFYARGAASQIRLLLGET